jgi:SAM-dependent methyltransferase
VRDAEFNDPRLVEVYDAACDSTRDDDYFVRLLDETPAARVLDVGCGTGRLALRLAAAGHTVTGIDPSAAALAAARAKSGAERVTWVRGTAASAPPEAFDVALMTGHVSQFLLTDDEWSSALRWLGRALIPGGRFAFNSYDPEARVWERWNLRESCRHVPLRDGAAVSIRTEVTSIISDMVSFAHHYRFLDGETLRSESRLRFWSEHRIKDSLVTAGFAIERVDGGWSGQAVGSGDGELIFIASWNKNSSTDCQSTGCQRLA